MRQKSRNLNGVLLLNKDYGVSSNRALQQVKRLFNASKAGHTGSLDPLATGVLPICFGEATKFSRFLLEADKTYQVTAKLGVITSTADAEGEIIATHPVPEFSLEQIQVAITSFLGASKQVPSMFSALKHNGQPLYKLARQGVSIERPARDIFIYEFKLLNQTIDTLEFTVTCSKGTYIRNLIEDLGAKLGCGAHVSKLARTKAGIFKLEDSYTLEQLQQLESLDSTLLPITTLLENLPQVIVSGSDELNIRNGRSVVTPVGVICGEVSLLNANNEFLGVGEALNDGIIAPRRLVATDTHC